MTSSAQRIGGGRRRTAHGGNYYRDQHGTWRYTLTDEEVPGAREDRRGMWAPELTAERLLAVEQVAEVTGLAPPTVRSYSSRGYLPKPVRVFAGAQGTPVWPEPIIQKWRQRRRGQGRRRRPAIRLPSGDGEELSVRAASEVLDVVTERIGQLVREGRLERIRRGYISRASLQRYLASLGGQVDP